MKPTPVLLMAYSLGEGGSERQLAETALALPRDRYAAHVASVLGGFSEARLERNGIRVTRFPLASYVRPGLMGALAKARHYIREHGIELVHAFDYSMGMFAVLSAKTAGACGVTSQRFFMDSVPPNYQRLLKLAHRFGNGIVANCDALRVYLHGEYGVEESKIHVCHNGLDPLRYPPGKRELLPEVADAPLVVGTVCVMRPEKNLDLLLVAFAQVLAQEPRAKLLIVGGGPQKDAIERQAREMGIAPSVVLLPATSDVPRVLNSIDMFVHPSRTEGFPNSVMEAMAAGRPVLATRVGGCPELIEDDWSGLLIPPNDQAALNQSLMRLCSDKDLRARLAGAAAARIRARFTIKAAAERMADIYDSLLGRGAPLNSKH